MDTRSARRAAEKAARDLVHARATVVGDLGVTSAEIAHRTTAVTAAQQQGQELVRGAHEQAERLVAAAQKEADAAAARYADAHARAKAAGWSSGDLDALGFGPTAPAGAIRRRRTPGPTTTQTAASAAEAAVGSPPAGAGSSAARVA